MKGFDIYAFKCPCKHIVPERDLSSKRGWRESAWLDEQPLNKIITGSLSHLISCHLFSCTGTLLMLLSACLLAEILIPWSLVGCIAIYPLSTFNVGGGNQIRNTIIKTPGQHLQQTSIPVSNFSLLDLSVMVHKGRTFHGSSEALSLSLPLPLLGSKSCSPQNARRLHHPVISSTLRTCLGLCCFYWWFVWLRNYSYWQEVCHCTYYANQTNGTAIGCDGNGIERRAERLLLPKHHHREGWIINILFSNKKPASYLIYISARVSLQPNT